MQQKTAHIQKLAINKKSTIFVQSFWNLVKIITSWDNHFKNCGFFINGQFLNVCRFFLLRPYQGDNFHRRFKILPTPVLIYKASIAKGPLSFPSCLLLQKIYRKTLTELHSDLNLGWLQYYWLIQCIYSVFFSNYLYFIWFLHVSAFVQKKSSIKNIYKTIVETDLGYVLEQKNSLRFVFMAFPTRKVHMIPKS